MTKQKQTNLFLLFLAAVGYVFLLPFALSSFLVWIVLTGFYVGVLWYCFIFFNADQDTQDQMAFGPINRAIECQLCRHVGSVRVTDREEKLGVSGGKAAGAVITGGLSVLVTGLSRTGWVTQCWCGHCKMKFYVR